MVFFSYLATQDPSLIKETGMRKRGFDRHTAAGRMWAPDRAAGFPAWAPPPAETDEFTDEKRVF